MNIRLSDWFSFRSRAATLPRSQPAVRRSSDERMSRTKLRASRGGSDALLSYVLSQTVSKYWCKCSFTLIATMHRSACPSQASWGSVFCSRTVEQKNKKKETALNTIPSHTFPLLLQCPLFSYCSNCKIYCTKYFVLLQRQVC